ncbi:MAG: sugar ABC transporter ATP-binding protein [Spirochaetales bacterium]|nr:sugar ABC transporter ATP-binding protein [Spirochaetales bacterium]MCF7937413.1 sugar ABC transporter ATP-binding protein [Spirochaetales bacterium]
MKDVSKQFPGTIAVDTVSFDVQAGEVHALVGENGAGKSTLMKMLAGSFNDYTGQIFIGGQQVKLHSPSIAKDEGIEMIYQELTQALPISIAENLLVGRLPRKKGFLDKKRMVEESKQLLERVGLGDLDPLLEIEEISQHQAQLVEIAKALGNAPSILVMDEPTSALSRDEVALLFGIIHKLRDEGLAIIYISHHLPEVFEVADRVTVMRDGKRIDTRKVSDVTTSELVEMMVGRKMEEMFSKRVRTPGKEKLRVENLSRYGFFHNVSFSAHEGEVLGIGGLAGAGRTELARAITGVDAIDEGEIFLDGKQIRIKNMTEALEKDVGYLTEDRKLFGLALRLTVGENILSALIPRLVKNFVFSSKRGAGKMKSLINELNIYPPDPGRTMSNLSGGNQQKVLLAKWLAIEPNVLFLDEPTRGVDVGAKVTIHKAIEKLADQGNAVIVVSSDLPELVGISDRIVMMRKGHMIGEIPGGEATEETVLLAANGEGRYVNAG